MPAKEKAPDPNRLPVGKFFAWKSRDISLAAMNTIVLGYLTLYCTTALGMSAALVGTLLLASKIFDAVTDLVAGYLVDNTNTKFGRGRPYEFAVIGVWISTVLLFSASPEWSGTVKAVWVFFTYSLDFAIFATLLGANQVPYTIRAFSNNQNVITKVASFGGIVSMLGGVVVSVVYPRLMSSIATSASGWTRLTLLFAVPLAAIGILRLVFVREDPSIDAGSNAKVNLKEILTMMRRNKYVWVYAGIMLLYNVITGLGAGSFYFTYIIGDISKFGIVAMLSVILLPVMFIFPAMIRKYSVSQLYLIFSAVSIAGYLIVFFAGANFPLVLFGIVLSSLLNLPLSFLGALVIMQLATYNEYIGLARMDASSAILAGLFTKVGGALGSMVAGVTLTAAGFIPTTDGQSVVQPDSALLMIRLQYSIIPLIGCVLIVVLAAILGTLSKNIPSVEQELAQRKAAAAPAIQEG